MSYRKKSKVIGRNLAKEIMRIRGLHSLVASHKKKFLFAAIFAFAGVALLIVTRAATPIAHFEAESASLSGGAVVESDTTASGGQAIEFTQAVECSGVEVTPSVGNLATFVKNYPGGTTFCFEPGTYNVTETIIPKSDQKLIAKPGAILDGGGVTAEGLKGFGGHQDRITVQGFEIRNFTADGIETGADWRVLDNEVHDTNVGIRLKKSSQAIRNKTHNNFKYGMVVNGPWDDPDPGTPIIIKDNEIAYNNTMRYDGGDSGGTKFLKATGMEVIGNWVHHNYGNGLWTDHENIHILYEDNLVEHNEGVGIFHEISLDAVIRNNTVRHNIVADGKSLFYGAQIYLNNSVNTEIYGNYVEAAYHGIGIMGSDRGGGVWGSYATKNVKVHDNEIHMSGQAKTGAVGHDYVTDPSSGNQFYSNTYTVPDNDSRWVWGGGNLSWTQWLATGNGTGSTLTVQ